MNLMKIMEHSSLSGQSDCKLILMCLNLNTALSKMNNLCQNTDLSLLLLYLTFEGIQESNSCVERLSDMMRDKNVVLI